MQKFEQLVCGNFYHIYNHAVGERDLFRDSNNYEYFMKLYDKFIMPVAKTYAWVLMKNHFHLLVEIKEESQVVVSLQFSKLFNAYAQAYNKYHQTRGALFERPFKRKLIDNDEYFQLAVLYIHNNPVHHGFCNHPMEYPWSSFHSLQAKQPTIQIRETGPGWFDDQVTLLSLHEKKIDIVAFEKWMEL